MLKQKKLINENEIIARVKKSMEGLSSKDKEDYQTVLEFDYEVARMRAEQNKSKAMEKVHSSAQLSFAGTIGICLPFVSAMWFDSVMPLEASYGAGIGLVGCCGYLAYSCLQYFKDTNKDKSILAERRAVLSACEMIREDESKNQNDEQTGVTTKSNSVQVQVR